jgi:hypothetical protein
MGNVFTDSIKPFSFSLSPSSFLSLLTAAIPTFTHLSSRRRLLSVTLSHSRPVIGLPPFFPNPFSLQIASASFASYNHLHAVSLFLLRSLQLLHAGPTGCASTTAHDVFYKGSKTVIFNSSSSSDRVSLSTPFASFSGLKSHSSCKHAATPSRRRVGSASSTTVRTTAVETLDKTAEVSLVEKSVNTIRFLSIDAVEKANSGHPGLPMSCAPMGHILYDEIMRYNPKNPSWFNRDRFVLSAGHGCMLQYALLHLAGYDSVKVNFPLPFSCLFLFTACFKIFLQLIRSEARTNFENKLLCSVAYGFHN